MRHSEEINVEVKFELKSEIGLGLALSEVQKDLSASELLLHRVLMVRMFGEEQLTDKWRHLDSAIESFLRRNDKE